MTWSIAGSAGPLTESTTSPHTVNCGQASTAGNLLVLYAVAWNSTTTVPTFTTPSNWALRKNVSVAGTSTSVAVSIFDYLGNPGGISSASLAFTGNAAAGQIVEFTCPGASSAAADQTGQVTATSATSPLNCTTSGNLAANNELAVAAFSLRLATSTSKTLAAGTGFTDVGGFNQGIAGTNHSADDYSLDTGASSGATVTDGETGWSTTSGEMCGAIATYIQGTSIPDLVMAPMTGA